MTGDGTRAWVGLDAFIYAFLYSGPDQTEPLICERCGVRLCLRPGESFSVAPGSVRHEPECPT